MRKPTKLVIAGAGLAVLPWLGVLAASIFADLHPALGKLSAYSSLAVIALYVWVAAGWIWPKWYRPLYEHAVVVVPFCKASQYAEELDRHTREGWQLEQRQIDSGGRRIIFTYRRQIRRFSFR